MDREGIARTMPNIGPVELVIILVIALLILGPGKLPDVGAAIGKSIREFRKATNEVQEQRHGDAGHAAARRRPGRRGAPSRPRRSLPRRSQPHPSRPR